MELNLNKIFDLLKIKGLYSKKSRKRIKKNNFTLLIHKKV